MNQLDQMSGWEGNFGYFYIVLEKGSENQDTIDRLKCRSHKIDTTPHLILCCNNI